MKTYRITIKGTDYDVVVGDLTSNPVTVNVNGEEFQVDLPSGSQPAASSSPTPTKPRTPAAPRPQIPASAPRPAAPSTGDDGTIRALMPGKIISVNVAVGQQVTLGQAMLVMESMKMENTISAVKDGTVTAVLVAEGDSVQHGQTMIEVEAQ